jgi:hypothetical protein
MRDLVVTVTALFAVDAAAAEYRHFVHELPMHSLHCVARPAGELTAAFEQLAGVSDIVVPYERDDEALLCALLPSAGSRAGFLEIQRPAGPALIAPCAIQGDAVPEACGKAFADVRGVDAISWSTALVRTGEGSIDDLGAEDLAASALGAPKVYFHDSSRGFDLVQFGVLLVSPLDPSEVRAVQSRIDARASTRETAEAVVPAMESDPTTGMPASDQPHGIR